MSVTAPITFASLIRPRPPERSPGFGRAILAPVQGVVVGVHQDAPDHDAYRGLHCVSYALTQRRRLAGGWQALAGNYVMIETRDGVVVAVCHLQRDGVVVAVCHLQRGSVDVRLGQDVRVGETLGRCGNYGNSTEPHVHVQAIDRLDVTHAAALPITFGGRLPCNGEIPDTGL